MVNRMSSSCCTTDLIDARKSIEHLVKVCRLCDLLFELDENGIALSFQGIILLLIKQTYR